MKKFLTAARALVLLLTLAACGGREGKEDPSGSPALYGVSEVQSVVDAGAFSESLEEVDADTAFALYKLADYGLERENMYDASVIRSAGATCEEMAVRCFDSEEQASKAVEALEDYVAGQITANEDYRPAEIPKLENALVKQLQHTVLLLVANDYEAAAIDAYHSKS